VRESLARRLKIFCRLSYVVCGAGLAFLYRSTERASAPEELPLSPEASLVALFALAAWAGLAVLVGVYLSVFLGVDVVGLNALLGLPTGKPFDGLEPGEEERLRFDYISGSIGWSNYNGVFKLCLTNQRLLVGVNLTSWYLLQLPLGEITNASVEHRRWFPPQLHLERLGFAGTEQWRITVGKRFQFDQLIEELKRLGVPFWGRG
jgi:hypothetical protein